MKNTLLVILVSTLSFFGFKSDLPQSKKAIFQYYLSHKLSSPKIEIEKVKRIDPYMFFNSDSGRNVTQELRSIVDSMYIELSAITTRNKDNIEKYPSDKKIIDFFLPRMKKTRRDKAFIKYVLHYISDHNFFINSSLRRCLSKQDQVLLDSYQDKFKTRLSNMDQKLVNVTHLRPDIFDTVYNSDDQLFEVKFKKENKAFKTIICGNLRCKLFCMVKQPKECS